MKVKVILEVLKRKILKKILKVLDLGCGFGRHKIFSKISKECVSLDISEEMLKLAKEYVPNKDVTNFFIVLIGIKRTILYKTREILISVFFYVSSIRHRGKYKVYKMLK